MPYSEEHFCKSMIFELGWIFGDDPFDRRSIDGKMVHPTEVYSTEKSPFDLRKVHSTEYLWNIVDIKAFKEDKVFSYPFFNSFYKSGNNSTSDWNFSQHLWKGGYYPLVRSPLVRKSFFLVFDPFSSEFVFDVTGAFLRVIRTVEKT